MKMVAVTAKSTNDRNKMIAAIVLGLLALIALYFAFGRSLFGGSSSAATNITVNTRPAATPSASRDFRLPTAAEQNFTDVTTPIDYRPGNSYAPDAGRNIFAFYEPPLPTPYVPTPIPPVVVKPPSPTPTPAYMIAFVNPQSVYAGSNGFRLEVNGDRFEPTAHIYFNQTEYPTTFVNSQKLFADIPSNLIATEGSGTVILQSPDGRKYSNQFIFNIQAPPRPTFQYVGMIGRKRYNNDTAYFIETGKTTPFGARLNDVVNGRFRLLSMSPAEAIFEDTGLGFRHRIPIVQTAASSSGGGPPIPPISGGFQNEPGFQQYNPGNIPQGDIPGIPNNLPRYVPPAPQPQQKKQPTDKDKKDVDDDDGDGNN